MKCIRDLGTLPNLKSVTKCNQDAKEKTLENQGFW